MTTNRSNFNNKIWRELFCSNTTTIQPQGFWTYSRRVKSITMESRPYKIFRRIKPRVSPSATSKFTIAPLATLGTFQNLNRTQLKITLFQTSFPKKFRLSSQRQTLINTIFSNMKTVRYCVEQKHYKICFLKKLCHILCSFRFFPWFCSTNAEQKILYRHVKCCENSER